MIMISNNIFSIKTDKGSYLYSRGTVIVIEQNKRI